MGHWEELNVCLLKKKQILEKIAANTETQCRFIHKREMKGLERVLDEREVLLDGLARINKKLASDSAWKNAAALAPMVRDITHQQRELLKRSKQVLQEAIAERACIAAELKSNTIRRQVKNGYVNPWANIAGGRLINEQG